MAHIINKINVLPRVNQKKTLSCMAEQTRRINEIICKAANAKQKLDAEIAEREQRLAQSREAGKFLNTIA